MLVPALVEQLHEAHPALQQPPGHEAVGAVELEHLVGLLGQVRDLGHRGLHPPGQLVLLLARGRAGVPRGLLGMQAGEGIEGPAAPTARDPRRVAEEQDRVGPRAQLHGLVPRGEEARAPEARVQGLPALVLGDHHAGRREVGIVRAQGQGHPGADRGAAGELGARLDEGDRRVVVDGLRGEAAHDAEPVREPRGVGQQLAELRSALAVALEGEGRAHQGQGGLVRGHGGQPLALADAGGQVLSLALEQQRLVVEQLQLARPAALEQPHDPTRAGRVVEDLLGAKDRREPQAEEARSGCPQRVASRGVVGAHRRLTLAWWEKTVTQVRVQAACSMGSRPLAGGASPTAQAAAASSGWAA